MTASELSKLKRLAQRMIDGLHELDRSMQRRGGDRSHMAGANNYALDLWNCANREISRRALAAAERADRGQVCWEFFSFSPSSGSPLKLAMFDSVRHVTRTPHRKLVEGEYFSIKPEWRVEESDPIEDLKREWARNPFDPANPEHLAKFNRYAAEVDEAIRRKVARDGSLEMVEVAA